MSWSISDLINNEQDLKNAANMKWTGVEGWFKSEVQNFWDLNLSWDISEAH